MPKRSRSSETEAGPSSSAAASIMIDAETLLKPPQKRFYRQRAHANVFIDHALVYPVRPEEMDWSTHYPSFLSSLSSSSPLFADRKQVEWADVGCGFGGLLMALAPLYPDTLMLGMEIRVAVTAYVADRIAALRQSQAHLPAGSPDKVKGGYENVSVIRANSMKHMPNFFSRGQLTKLFFLFPDPHFKLRKQKARIITNTLLAEYAYVLRRGGILYTVTDVKDLHVWMTHHLNAHPLFEYIPISRLADDPILEAARMSTEEGRKVERNKGEKWVACFKRNADPPEDED